MIKNSKRKIIYIFIIFLLIIILVFATIQGIQILKDRVNDTINNKINKELNIIRLELKKTNVKLGRLTSSKNIDFDLNKIKFKKSNFNDWPFGYLEQYKNDIIFAHAGGDIFFGNKTENLEEIEFVKIESNIKNFFINDNKKDSYFNNSIRDILVYKNSIYVVYIDKINTNNQYQTTTSVLKSNLNKNYLVFSKIFSLKDRYPESIVHAGGKIQHFDNDFFILAVPDNGDLIGVNSEKVAIGKTILFEDNDKIFEYNIFTKGHRNPQGLFHDKQNNIILLTEHGPAGGDEINIIKQDKNYGWPTASYGEANQPTFDNHKANGFEEPIYYWGTNPGISEIIKVSDNFYQNYDDCYFIASLSGSNELFGHHIYVFCINKSENFQMIDKIYVGERIRDIIYVKSHNAVMVVLENSNSLGIISK
jgi:hypothetical protein